MLLLLLSLIPGVRVQEAGNSSSTQDPLDLFREQGFPQVPQESQPFGNFDLEPQQPRPTTTTTPPPAAPPFFQDNSQSFQQPTRRFRPQNVNELGIPLPEISSVDPTTRSDLWSGPDPFAERCPRNWERFENSCYKFTRSPIKRWSDARELCRAYRHGDQDKADLASVDTFKEHMFISSYLNQNDPQHRRWYISTRQDAANQWINQGDGTQMLNLQQFFLKSKEWGELEQADHNKDFLVYDFDLERGQWGFRPVFGQEEYLYICEVPIKEVKFLINDDRTAEYGQPLGDPRYVPMGPVFVRQPNRTVFDGSLRKSVKDVSLLCIAQAWPPPTYAWFKEQYTNDTLTDVRVDPMQDSRITISGGQLIIHAPDQSKDKGTYFCTATNEFGTIRSKSVSLSFGFIGEFILRRSNEVGSENWGKAISCDPPHHYPKVKYYWAREYFPNFVEEDRRVMVSYDGYIYFSALENIDRGKYSCNVGSSEFNTGRNGPFFEIDVLPHPNAQQLRFPQNFPKSFPEAPLAGEDVRLECIAFGYPVPHYNWTRAGSSLPRGAYMTNYNRVLIIPRVRVEDQGEYVCTAKNDKVNIKGTLTLSIQSRPVFTIHIGDQFVDENDEVIWTCEAFGIPRVTYSWLRNGVPLITDPEKMAPEDRGRYELRDNVLKIKQVLKRRDEGMYQCKATNDLDSRYSSGQLRVLTLAPSFVKKPLDEMVYAAQGGNVTLECEAEAAPRPKITWYKDDKKLADGGKIRLFPNGNLYIKGLVSEDTGRYECIATNKYGRDQNSTYLKIIDPPTFQGSNGESPFPRIITKKGANVQLRCKADAKDFLDRAYYWRLNDVILEFVEDYEQDRLLELKNAGGSRVNINQGFNKQVVFKSLDTRMQLLSSAWLNNNDNRNKGTGDFQKFRRGLQDGSLTIHNISLAESGKYECAVESVVGTIYGSTEVIVQSAPGPPGGVTAVKLKARSGTVVWTDGAFYSYNIDSYRIEGRTDHNQTWVLLGDRVQGSEIEYQGGRPLIDGRRKYDVVDQLSPWSAYSFRVAAYNSLGLGDWSEPSPQYNTRPDKPYKPVTNLRSDGGRTGDLTLRWDPLPKQDQNAPGVYYRIYYRRVGVEEERDFQQKTLKNLGNVGMYVIRIPEKFYYTTYEVKVQVFNSMCEEPECSGPMSETAVVRSAEDLPQVAPTEVGARPFNSTAINVTWTPIPNIREKVRGKLIGYRIKYWRKELNEVTDSQYMLSRSTEPHALIIGLLPNSYYYVKAMAYNSAGPGLESPRFLERTFKLRPQKPPSAVQVFGINPSTIRVTWRFVSPSVAEEPLTGFKVRVWENDKDISEATETIIPLGNNLEATISNLTPGKTYKLRVLAFSQGGDGKMSSPVWQFQMGDPKSLNAAGLLQPLVPSVLLSLVLILHTSIRMCSP